MTENRRIKRTIAGKTDGGTEFSIHFWSDDYEDAIDAYFGVENTAKLIELVGIFRKQSNEVRAGFYCPHEGIYKNQMEKLCIAAAASYPRLLISNFIETNLGIPYNSYRVYATVKEHESSDYLSLDDKKGISISTDGIIWLKNHLEIGDSR